jgi:parvulin-like peptidyl-prolyl isomerase
MASLRKVNLNRQDASEAGLPCKEYNLFIMRRDVHFSKANFLTIIVFISWLLAACTVSEQPTATASEVPASSPTPTITASPPPPTPTPVPLAAIVNGEGITLEEYKAELARFNASQEGNSSNGGEESEQRVLDDLINQILLAQGALKSGFVVEVGSLRGRLDELEKKAGGEQAFNEWMELNGYGVESFEKALARSIAAAWMRDQILTEVPEVAEQLHVRQILLYNSDDANEVLAQLEAGKDFASLAAAYDPITLGDLGWFPRGYLTTPELEQAAFSLQPDEYSQVIETSLGFHILQVIERDPQRPLDPEARLVWQEKALQDWLEAQQKQSDIEILIP